MKIAFVITGLGIGGAERVVVALADYMAASGHLVTLVYLTGSASVLPQQQSVRLISLGMRGKWGVVFVLWKLCGIIKSLQPDVVHAHLFHAIMLCRISRLFVKFPKLIDTIHNSKDGGKIRMLLYRATDFLGGDVTNVSLEAAESFSSAGAVRRNREIIAIPNGVDVKKYKFLSESRGYARKACRVSAGEYFILSVGRLEAQKNYDNLLHAMQNFKNKKNMKSFIVGDGALRNDLEILSAELGLTECVKFLGIRHDVPALMCAADVFVLSSDYEGLPLVVAEAMACGCIVVATDCGGVREVLGDAGYLVPPRDPAALAQAVVAALELDAPSRRALSEKARRRVVENYSSDSMCEKYLALYGAQVK